MAEAGGPDAGDTPLVPPPPAPVDASGSTDTGSLSSRLAERRVLERTWGLPYYRGRFQLAPMSLTGYFSEGGTKWHNDRRCAQDMTRGRINRSLPCSHCCPSHAWCYVTYDGPPDGPYFDAYGNTVGVVGNAILDREIHGDIVPPRP